MLKLTLLVGLSFGRFFSDPLEGEPGGGLVFDLVLALVAATCFYETFFFLKFKVKEKLVGGFVYVLANDPLFDAINNYFF